MSLFTWTTNPLTFQELATSAAFDTLFNELAGWIGQTPSNVDMSQLGEYNAGFYGYNSTASMTQFTSALNAVAAAAQQAGLSSNTSGGGGRIRIPYVNLGFGANGPNAVQVNGIINLVPPAVVTAGGYSNSDISAATNSQTIQQTVNSDLFYFNCGSGSGGNLGGQYIHDLRLSFADGLSGNIAALHCVGGQEWFIERVLAKEAPVGFMFDNTLHSNAFECDAIYSHAANVNNAVGFMVGNPTASGDRSNQVRLNRCQVGFTTNNGTGSATGVLIQAVIHCVVDDMYVFGAPVAYSLLPSAINGNSIEQVTMQNCQAGGFTQYGFLIQPASSTGSGGKDIHIIGGRTQQSVGGGLAGTVGVFVGVNGQTANAMQDVKLLSHSIENCGLYGLQLDGGQNLQVIGGTFGSNGTAGLALTGSSPANYAGAITITDVDLQPEFEGGSPQTYGIYVPTGVTINVPILVKGCTLTGYGNWWQAISVLGTLTNFKVEDCPGYTDVTAAVATGASVTSGTAFNGTTIGSHPYFGKTRLQFTYTGTITGLTVSIANNQGMLGSTALTATNFYNYELEANEWLELTWTGGGTITVSGVGH